jgi:hypothetical protein
MLFQLDFVEVLLDPLGLVDQSVLEQSNLEVLEDPLDQLDLEQ